MRSLLQFHAKKKKDISKVQQEYKPFHVLLEDYLNGNVTMPQSDDGSFEFQQEGDVDFNAPMDSGHHDIYDVASGHDPVFRDSVAVSDTTPQASPTSVESELVGSPE